MVETFIVNYLSKFVWEISIRSSDIRFKNRAVLTYGYLQRVAFLITILFSLF